jgi:hypothetical protein
VLMNKKLTLTGISITVAVIVFLLLSNPLRQSDEAIETWLLKSVPIGANLNQLEIVAKQQGWKINSMWDENKPNSDWGGVDGAKVVWVYIGGYHTFFKTDIDSFWAFDESGHLASLKIRRMTDAL